MQVFKALEVRIRRFRNIFTPLWYRGDNRYCPACKKSFSRFLPAGNKRARRLDAVCPFCRSRERDRLLSLLLDTRADLFDNGDRVLHFAPEPTIQKRLSSLSLAQYDTTDLMRTDVSFQGDIQALNVTDGSYSRILCAHVLQDVPDEEAALSEIARILVQGGRAIISIPITSSATTQLAAPKNQRASWDQRPGEHVRVYGLDFGDRLREFGFDTECVHVRDLVQVAEDIERYGLLNEQDTNVVFLCTKV